MSEVKLEWIIELARAAGAHIKAAFVVDKKIEYKGENDLVTDTDKAVEEAIITSIRAKFPTHHFLAEESSALAEVFPSLTDAPTWIIDPVDGTTNFAHSHPFVAVSIAFAVNKVVQMGVVYNPVLDELFYAERGSGAFLNGQRISVSTQTSIGRSLVTTGFNAYVVGAERGSGMYASSNIPYPNGVPPTRETRPPLPKTRCLDATLNNLHAALCLAQDVRRCGSAALDMCYVACGRYELYFEWGPREWDFAAGLVILQEAGGIITRFDGSEFDISCRDAVAANSRALADQLIPYLELPVIV